MRCINTLKEEKTVLTKNQFKELQVEVKGIGNKVQELKTQSFSATDFKVMMDLPQ